MRIFANFGIGVFAIANFAFGAVAVLGNVAAAVGWSVGNIAAGYRAFGEITAQWAAWVQTLCEVRYGVGKQ